MIIIVCLDEHNGMMFHGKRQSRDKALTETVVDEKFLEKAGIGEIYLVETERLMPVLDRIEEIFIFR